MHACVPVEELDVDTSKLTHTVVRALGRAEDEARRRGHGTLLAEHLFAGLVQVDWPFYARAMRDAEVPPDRLVQAVDQQLDGVAASGGQAVRVPPQTHALLAIALHRATRTGRDHIDTADLFSAIFEDPCGGVALALDRIGLTPASLVEHFASASHVELRDERLLRRYELPPFLRQFATNLNLLARQDKLNPVFGRDRELRQMIEILCHRDRSNSVMLIGEPGVGKTAVAEALAARIELQPRSLPVQLRDCQILNLPINSLVAGTMLRGMFEDRVQNVLREVREHPHYILFVDEAHTMVGAGSALGAPSDAANVIKSALARGEVRMIGATTLGEYKQHIAEDEALARRFRTITVAEPSADETRRLLQGLKPRFACNYAVQVQDEAIEMAIGLAPRYQRHLRLPDKAIGWLDTAAVRVQLEARSTVTAQDVLAVVSTDANIPPDLVARDVTARFKECEATLARRVVGQPAALRAVAQRMTLNKGPLKERFDRPDGVLLFVGPTGVGKTEVAKALAEFLFGDERRLIRIDMSEYQEGSAPIDKLIGAPRGVVGSERGGALTNALRDQPYSVVLLDEIEKASPSLLNVFLQAFDEGWITDGRGRRVYLSDAIVIMTSNVGAEHVRKLASPLGFGAEEPRFDGVRGDITRELSRRFSPEFRNRIDDVIVFEPLSREHVTSLVRAGIDRLTSTLRAAGKSLEIEDAAVAALVDRGYSVEFGARALRRLIEDAVKMPISQAWNAGAAFHVKLVEGEIVVEVEERSAPRLLAAS